MTYTNDYLQEFDLDPTLIGNKLSQGKQHFVYRYGADQIIKIPQNSVYMKLYGSIHYETIARDVELLRQYLGEFVVPTTVLQGRQHPDRYVIVQEFLPDAVFITADRVADVRDDLARMAQGNHQLLQNHRLSLDFFGNYGFRQSIKGLLLRRRNRLLMNNILAAQRDGKWCLFITDINLSELRVDLSQGVNPFHWLVDLSVFHLTRWMIHFYFGIRV